MPMAPRSCGASMQPVSARVSRFTGPIAWAATRSSRPSSSAAAPAWRRRTSSARPARRPGPNTWRRLCETAKSGSRSCLPVPRRRRWASCVPSSPGSWTHPYRSFAMKLSSWVQSRGYASCENAAEGFASTAHLCSSTWISYAPSSCSPWRRSRLQGRWALLHDRSHEEPTRARTTPQEMTSTG